MRTSFEIGKKEKAYLEKKKKIGATNTGMLNNALRLHQRMDELELNFDDLRKIKKIKEIIEDD